MTALPNHLSLWSGVRRRHCWATQELLVCIWGWGVGEFGPWISLKFGGKKHSSHYLMGPSSAIGLLNKCEWAGSSEVWFASFLFQVSPSWAETGEWALTKGGGRGREMEKRQITANVISILLPPSGSRNRKKKKKSRLEQGKLIMWGYLTGNY